MSKVCCKMKTDVQFFLEFFALCVCLFVVPCDAQSPSLNPNVLASSKTIGECHACKLFIDSFKKGLERTARGKYEGGDAAWEEEKLKKSYKRSEIRLVDIQEGICKEETKYAVQCHHMAEKSEEYIEAWWAQNPDESEDLYTYICIDKMKMCCPKHHYGSNCTPCPGDHSNLCNGNGKCRGDGTRKGNGTCWCDPGYMGQNCDSCAQGYYQSSKNNEKLVCSKCHRACEGGCREGTQKDCISCRVGFVLDTENGCTDVNECDNPKTCGVNEFCLNSLGSYACMKCDKSCKGCYSDSPDTCIKCSKGYSKIGEFCIADSTDDQGEQMTSTRYKTYIGLIVTAGILLPRSTSLGSIVGVIVISYIMGAEYYCMINGHIGLVNLKEYDLFHIFHL